MALTIQITCSNRQQDFCAHEEEFDVATISDSTAQRLREYLESKGWVVRFNGDYMDTYCSKKCANITRP